MSSDQRLSKKIEQIFPIILFLILVAIVLFFINNSKGENVSELNENTNSIIPTIVFDETLCEVVDKDNYLKTLEVDLPTYSEILSIEAECDPNDYPGDVIRLNIKEAYSYLTFALEKDLPILGWENVKSQNLSTDNESKAQIIAEKAEETLHVEVRSVEITAKGKTSITYKRNNE